MELENQQNIALNHIHNHIKCDWSKKKKKQFKKRDYQKDSITYGPQETHLQGR